MNWAQLRDTMSNAVRTTIAWATRYEVPIRRYSVPVFAAVMFGIALSRSWPVGQMEGTYRDVFVLSDHIASHAFVASLLSTLNAAFGVIIVGAAVAAMTVSRTGQNRER